MNTSTTTRRRFLSTAAMSAAAAAAAPLLSQAAAAGGLSAAAPSDQGLPTNPPSPTGHYRPPYRFGLGGVAIGNGFRPATDAEAGETLAAAWAGGVRYYDTSPWYGLGLSERRFGHFLHNQNRGDYVLSTKVGRVLSPSQPLGNLLWKNPAPFKHTYDYTAAGARRSIEDSLQRLGVERIDIVFIHDLSPDNPDLGERWPEYFDIAAKGAMPELTKMREEGLIKAWGFGVNTIEPILRALNEGDPDIFLSATQYSLMHHEEEIARVFPACEKRGVSLVVGAPLNAGFLAGADRYDYRGKMPEGFLAKRDRLSALAKEYGTDLRTAALQFCAAPAVVSSVIPGARSARQVTENIASMKVKIPAAFWAELKREKLIAENAPTPA
ncbi:MAG TPA: aldo/keto reductase [Chthoniobacterales bacterium]